MRQVINRLKEPSTWAAVGAALVALGLGTEELWVSIGGGIAAILGVVVPERGERP